MWLLENPLTRGALEIVLIVAFGLGVRFVVVRLIRRLVRDAVAQKRIRNRVRRRTLAMATAWAGERGEQRAQALGSLATSIVTVIVTGSILIGILGVLGFNLTPLLASAGVIGVALGFGAQNLIKDLIAGVGFLMEDQLGVGDAVDMDKGSGTVEAVGLRVTKLRDPNGMVWYVRNGEVLRVGNKSQGWSQIVLDVEVAYDTDLAQAQAILARVATEVAARPEFAEVIIEPPKLVGIEKITAAGVTIRVLGTCRTDQNGGIERELRTRVKTAFDEAGVVLAPVPPVRAEPAPDAP